MGDGQVNNGIVNRSQYYNPMQQYTNMVGLYDLADEICGCGSSSLYGGGIFGGGMNGMGSMYGMNGMGYGPGSERMKMTALEAIKNDADIRNAQLQSNLNYEKKLKSANYEANSGEKQIALGIENLHESIIKNEQNNFSTLYTNLESTVKNSLCNEGCSDDKIMENLKGEVLDRYYKQKGKSLTTDLEEHSDSSFVHGLKQGTGVGYFLTDEKTAEENISDITGKPESTSSKAWTWAGRIVAGALTLAALPFLYRGGAKAIKFIGKGWTKAWKAAPEVEKSAEQLMEQTFAKKEAMIKIAKTEIDNLEKLAKTKAQINIVKERKEAIKIAEGNLLREQFDFKTTNFEKLT